MGKRGFSLVEIMIAMGLVGLLALGLTSVMNITFKASKFTQSTADLSIVRAQLMTMLGDPENCKKALQGVRYENHGSVPVAANEIVPIRAPAIHDPLGTGTFLTLGTRFGSLVAELPLLIHQTGLVLNGNTWDPIAGSTYEAARASFEVSFVKESELGGTSKPKVSIPIFLHFNNSTIPPRIDGCSAMLSNGAGWNCTNSGSGCDPGVIPAVNTSGTSFEPSGMQKQSGGMLQIKQPGKGSIQFDFE